VHPPKKRWPKLEKIIKGKVGLYLGGGGDTQGTLESRQGEGHISETALSQGWRENPLLKDICPSITVQLGGGGSSRLSRRNEKKKGKRNWELVEELSEKGRWN